MITSVQNEKVKLTKSLQREAKIRHQEGLIVLEGVRLVRDALLMGHKPELLFATTALNDTKLLELAKITGTELLNVSDAVMQSMSDTQQPQAILGVFPMPKAILPDRFKHALILDSIRDPGNLGTLLRTAAAAGVEAVLLSPTCADPYNPKALRGGMGAHFRIAIANYDWDQIKVTCAGKKVYMADGAGDTPYHDADWSGDWELLIGSEAHGPGDQARKLATSLIRIPMAAATESLNAAVAAGIILFEAMRSKKLD